MNNINEEILGSEVFTETRRLIVHEYDRQTFPNAAFLESSAQIDWNLGLFLVSALDDDGSTLVQQSIMDICFGALQSDSASRENKTAAAILLERYGNWPSIDLAKRRNLVDDDYRRQLPAPIRMDSVQAKLEHTVTPATGSDFLGSRFQRLFWKEAKNNDWVSVSAPTSAGKSYVVKRWIIDQACKGDDTVILYIVPTRALVDEVSKALLVEPALEKVHIHSIPWDSSLMSQGAHILVMTQERAQISLDRNPGLIPTAAFFDEAQKIGDGYRGMLLEEVVQEAVRRNPKVKAVFASPMTMNPEILLSRSAPESSVTDIASVLPSVNQNLYWMNQIPRKSPFWSIERSVNGKMEKVAEISLDQEPNPASKRLAAIPAKLASPTSLNIVYANTAAEAETCSKQIFEYLGEKADVHDQRIVDLQELIRKSVHPSYLLAAVISRGVAFHYGNMPQPVRLGIEALYRDGLIRFLVCTSTLLEGVNLPCTNIWIMNPRRGQGNPMTTFDFWNLAGRAGRWGSEFSGNIICIATKNKKGWPDPPKIRTAGYIEFATEAKIRESERIVEFIASDGIHPTDSKRDDDLEAIAAHLFDASNRDVVSAALSSLEDDKSALISGLVDTKEEQLRVPADIRRSHPGINPQAMDRLFNDLASKKPESLPLLSPHDDGAFEQLIRALARCERNLRSGFGPNGNQARLAVLLLDWMRGRPIPWLVSERINYEKKRNPEEFSSAKCIRWVLEDVEQVARFRAPKYLGCYADIAGLVASSKDAKTEQPDVMMMLELGVSRPTEVSLMSLGLSRTATIHVSEFIAEDDLSPAAAVDWLGSQDLSSLGIPAMIVREVESVVARALTRNTLRLGG